MKRQGRVALGSIVFLAITLSTSVVATPVLDQTSLPAYPHNTFSDFGGSVQQAQTFQVGVSGTLLQLDVLGTGSGKLDIRGQTASHPDNAVVLQTVDLPPLAGPSTFNAVPLNLPVSEGEFLSFVVYGGSGTLIGSINSNYERGELWTFGNPPFGLDGPGSWYPNGAGNQKIELAFSTFVDVPEPGNPGLLVLGFGSLAIFLGRKRSRKDGTL